LDEVFPLFRRWTEMWINGQEDCYLMLTDRQVIV